MPDHVVVARSGVGGRQAIERALFELPPGVTELHVRPAADLPELRSFAPDWAERVDDLHDATTTSSARSSTAPASFASATGRCATSSGPAGARRRR